MLADAVKYEVEENLLLHTSALDEKDAQQMLDDYARLLELANPESVPYPSKAEVLAYVEWTYMGDSVADWEGDTL